MKDRGTRGSRPKAQQRRRPEHSAVPLASKLAVSFVASDDLSLLVVSFVASDAVSLLVAAATS